MTRDEAIEKIRQRLRRPPHEVLHLTDSGMVEALEALGLLKFDERLETPDRKGHVSAGDARRAVDVIAKVEVTRTAHTVVDPESNYGEAVGWNLAVEILGALLNHGFDVVKREPKPKPPRVIECDCSQGDD